MRQERDERSGALAPLLPSEVYELIALTRARWGSAFERIRLSGHPTNMATAPSFAATVLLGAAVLSATADTSFTAPANAVNVVTAGAAGSKVDEITFQGTGTTIAGIVTVFLFDGTNYHLYDVIQVPAVTASTTIPPWRYTKQYPSLVLPSGWSLRCSSTVASQLISVSALGGSF